MNALTQTFQPAQMQKLHATPRSKHLLQLLQQSKEPLNPLHLLETQVLMWGLEHEQAETEWATNVLAFALQQERKAPQQLTEMLADAPLEQAQTLQEASMMLLRVMADVIPA